MAITVVAADNRVTRFESQIFSEYVRGNQFAQDMANSTNAIHHVNERLTGEKGEEVSIPLVTRLTGSGVTGNNELEGNEEQMDNYAKKLTTDVRRNAVATTEKEKQVTVIDLLQARREVLLNWLLDQTRDSIIDSLRKIINGAVNVTYETASAANRNGWHVANIDRLLYGNAAANYVVGDHAASLGNITAAMTLSKAIVRLARRIARTNADPHIRPARVKNSETGAIEEWFKLYVPTFAFRDLQDEMDPTYQGAGVRGKGNPIFNPGDLIVDNVIVREVPEMPTIAGVGAAGIDVAQCALCGAQATGIAYAMRSKSITDVRDYGFVHGAGIMEYVAYDKMSFNNKDHGMLTLFVAGVADA
ncbi:MAG: DUF4043 family protein [Pseudomonadota bacterium]